MTDPAASPFLLLASAATMPAGAGPMPLLHRLVFLAVALAVAGTIVELIRRRHLREAYAMLWLGVSAVLLVFGLVPELLAWIAETSGIHYQTVALLVCFAFLIAIVIQLCVVLSRRADESRQLVQRVAMLQERLERIEADHAADKADP